MADSIRTQTSGSPTWTASAGAQAIDKLARILYVNMTSGAADWLAIDISSFALSEEMVDINAKLSKLIRTLIDLGLDDVEEAFPEELETVDDSDDDIEEG